MKPPAKTPCGSCPYRRDVPSGVWAAEEYEKLPPYDRETGEQPPAVFHCHRQDGRVCAGWAGCHDMEESLGARLAASMGWIEGDALLGYETSTPLWDSGAEAAEHGLREIGSPSPEAQRVIGKLTRQSEVQQ